MPEIQKADPAARKKAAALVLLGVSVMVLCLPLIDAHLEAIREAARDDPKQALERMVQVLYILGAPLALPCLGLAVWLWRFSTRIDDAHRYPPPGTALVRDVRVLTGKNAHRRALAGHLLALVLAAAALGIVLAILGIVASMGA